MYHFPLKRENRFIVINIYCILIAHFPHNTHTYLTAFSCMNLDIINSGITCKVRTSDALYDDLEVLWLRRNVDFLNSPLIVVDKLSKMVQNKMLIGSKLKIYLKQGIALDNPTIVFDLITAHTPISALSSNFMASDCSLWNIIYCFIIAYVVCTHLNCLDKSRQFKWVHTTYAFINLSR